MRIWGVALLLASCAHRQSLFNGHDLSSWEGDPRHWSVVDGTITGVTTADSTAETATYLIWRGGTVRDFELRVVYRFVTPGNSGLQYRSQDQGEYMVTGYQADFETSHGQKWTGSLVEMGGRLHLALRGQRTQVSAGGKVEVIGSVGDPEVLEDVLRPDGWNELIVVARHNRLVHRINGKVMVDVTDHAGVREGLVALQLGRSGPMKVQFKTVDMRPL